MKTLVLGIGNLILRDDGIGPRLIQELRDIIIDSDIVLQETSLAGIHLMEMLVGFDRAIIVDSIMSGGEPGKVYLLTLQDFSAQHESVCLHHNMDLFQAIELGKALAQPMPAEVSVVAIEAKDVTNFGEGLTQEVERAIPIALEQVLLKINAGEDCGYPI